MSSHAHLIEYGSCGHVLTQCRCMGPKVSIQRDYACSKCGGTAKPDPTPIPAPTQDDLLVSLDGLWQTLEHHHAHALSDNRIRGLIRRCFAAERDRDAALERVRELEAQAPMSSGEPSMMPSAEERCEVLIKARYDLSLSKYEEVFEIVGYQLREAIEQAFSDGRASRDAEVERARREEREACAICIPTSWLDPLFSGPMAVIRDLPANGNQLEHLMRALQARIRARTQREGA